MLTPHPIDVVHVKIVNVNIILLFTFTEPNIRCLADEALVNVQPLASRFQIRPNNVDDLTRVILADTKIVQRTNQLRVRAKHAPSVT